LSVPIPTAKRGNRSSEDRGHLECSPSRRQGTVVLPDDWPQFSRPLRSPLERGRDGGGSAYCEQDEAQQTAQPSENEAEVVADSGEDDVSGVALAALEVATAEVPVSLHVANDGFDGRAAAQFALDDAEDAVTSSG
jgi:hypothetical protein